VKIAVGLIQNASVVKVSFEGTFRDEHANLYAPGAHQFSRPIVLEPVEPDSSVFVLDDFTIGIGFHWERRQPRPFRGGLRVIEGANGFTAINDVELETYIESVIASEMSPQSPPELLRAHAIVSRSWIVAQLGMSDGQGTFHNRQETAPGEWEILCWYGHEGHAEFDVCADDHCQRYQGVPPEGTENAWRSVEQTRGRFLVSGGEICDARFYKCCGGVTEDFRAAWEDRDVPYLTPVSDGPGAIPKADDAWIRRGSPDAYCNTGDAALLGRIFTGYDQETADFFRWRVEYRRQDLSQLIGQRTGIDIGHLKSLEPLERGRSGRIIRLRIRGTGATLTVGKELEIRRALSESHLYSSAFVVDHEKDRIVLSGAGWGHGVGLCQVGAAVMAERGRACPDILRHYYPGAEIEERT
jgi:stage II sporulation protein D